MSDLPFKPVEADEVFNINDFETIELEIHFQNQVTGMNFMQGVSMSETGDYTMTLELPPKSCNMGQNVLVEVYKKSFGVKSNETTPPPSSKKPRPILSFTGKITEFETLETAEVRAKIKLVQFEEKEWMEFLGLFSKRQDEINQFISSVRGY